MMPERNRAIGLAVLLAMLSSGAAGAQWTIGVYMCADNGLNDVAYQDINEMKQVGSTDEVRTVVQVEFAARDPLRGGHRYLIKKDGVDTLANLGPIDMADPATLSGFAEFLRRGYPASNYMLVLWDHGNGWYPGQGPSRSIFIDESHGHTMGVAGGELATALADVKRALGGNVRVLGFDACLMGMAEVAAEVSGACDYMVASQVLEPSGGWPYDKLLEQIVSRPTRTPLEFLSQLCSDYVEQYPADAVALSVLDMRRFEEAVAVMKATFADSVNPAAPAWRSARSGAQSASTFRSHVDFIHLLELASQPGTARLRAALEDAVIANRTRNGLDDCRGLAVWFPETFLALESRVDDYLGLSLGRDVRWLEFLNGFFGVDDQKPAQTEISDLRQGGRSDLRLWWNSSFDLAPVSYDLYEATRPTEVLSDNADTTANWMAWGWTASAQKVHSPGRAFYSGSGSNLDNFLESVKPLYLRNGGLLSVYATYTTEETWDSLAGFSRDICYVEWSPDRTEWHKLDSLYGEQADWRELRYVLPGRESLYLRFRYVTNATRNEQGVFLDDIKVYRFDSLRVAAAGVADTTAEVFGAARDTIGYNYFVTARDSFGNVSSASQFCVVPVKTWAEPYTRPAPFAGECDLVLDFPSGMTVDVLLYTLSGMLVRRFDDVRGRVLVWDGKNDGGKDVADGLYLVAVQGEGFKKIGKIARVSGP
jgi:hypothetical protein